MVPHKILTDFSLFCIYNHYLNPPDTFIWLADFEFDSFSHYITRAKDRSLEGSAISTHFIGTIQVYK